VVAFLFSSICEMETNYTKMFCRASKFFHLPLFDFMKENGVDEILKQVRSHYYAKISHLGVVEYLIKQKADINRKEMIGELSWD